MMHPNIRPNAPVVAADGEIGRVKHVIVDPGTRQVSELVVEEGGREWLVPVAAVGGGVGSAVLLRGTRQQVLTNRFNPGRFRPAAGQAGPATPVGDPGNRVAAERGAASPPRTEAATVPGSSGPRPAEADGEIIRIPLRREEITLEKRWVVTEQVDITRLRTSESERFTDTVRREEAVVDTEGELNVHAEQTGR